MTKIRTEEEEQEILERKSKMTSKTENICECGHKRRFHFKQDGECFRGRVSSTQSKISCPCKKFQPVGRKK